MEIRTLTGVQAVDHAGPAAESGAATGSSAARPAAVDESSRSQPEPEKPDPMDELKALVSAAHLELRIQPLQGSNVMITKIVEPLSGRVVREFPAEGLAEALAQLRSRAAEHLDGRA